MVVEVFCSWCLFFFKVLIKRFRNLSVIYRKGVSNSTHFKLQIFHSIRSSFPSKLGNQTLLCHVDTALLKSSTPFPYFMLVSFESGGILRAFVLFLLYPLIYLVSDEMGLKIMVFISFCGIKEDGFRTGRSVLPKFFMEDLCMEGFDVLMKAEKKLAVSDLPKVMIEGFLLDYLKVDAVLGRNLKVVRGFYVGLFEDIKQQEESLINNIKGGEFIGIAGSNKSLYHRLFSQCKEMYVVTEADRRNWNKLPRERYPEKMIFHDGRLAFRATPVATLVMLMWLPLGLPLALFRAVIARFFPYEISIPILSMTGMSLRIKKKAPRDKIYSNGGHHKGTLYVCNHRTLLDPLYLSATLNQRLTAVTYSLSRVSEMLSPIKTIRLTRNREEDKRRMEKMLRLGDLVVCPEGTTCREPFLLRFSPLFAEVSDEIIPVAVDVHVGMFYGTTASGFKCLDPFFFLLNPFPGYVVQILPKVDKQSFHGDGDRKNIEIANFVQGEIGKTLGFVCTRLTRKEKYMILAGNEGFVAGHNNETTDEVTRDD